MRLIHGLQSQTVKLDPIAETLERLRWTANLSQQQWLDVIGIQWWQYHCIKAGIEPTPETVIERAAQYFNIKPEDITSGTLEFAEIAAVSHRDTTIPDRYADAAFGRQRTTITSLEFLENYYGWRLKLDTLNAHHVTEADLRDPFSPISMNLISDICTYLHDHRHFRAEHFLAMGAYSYIANRHTLVGQLLSEQKNPVDLYDFFFHEALKLFEQNCNYTITKQCPNGITVEIVTNADVAAECGVRHLGNIHICHLKAGMLVTLTRYLDLPNAKVRKTACVHRGDSACRYEIEFPQKTTIGFTPHVLPEPH